MNINPYDQVLKNIGRSEPLVARYHGEGALAGTRAEIEEKIKDRVLHVLVHGAYNAGKSTLINVLVGKEHARTGEIPTTDRVDGYDWNGCRLLDTPGVNAPIKHEQATADQLARTNAVVLVVREGDQDAKDVYHRLFRMMQEKKAIFIILNHQLGSDEEIVMAIQRIRNLMSRFAAERGVADTEVGAIPIYPVNLNTALTGRLRRRGKLLEHSGFMRFVDAFSDWTRQHDNQNHHLSEIKDTVRSLWYGPAIARVQELAEADDESDAEQLRDAERTLTAKKSRLHGEGYSLAERHVNGIRVDLGELMRSSESREEFDDGLKDLVRPMVRTIEGWLHRELDGVDARVTATVEAPEVSEKGDGRSRPADSPIAEVTNVAMQKVGEAATNKKAVMEVLLKLRGTKAFGIRDLLGLKGKWASTLDKWATGFTKVARGGAVVLQIAIAAWDAKRAHDRQTEENEQVKRQAVESFQAIESICGVLRSDLVGAMDAVIDDALGADMDAIRARIGALTREMSEKDRHYQELLSHQSQLDGIVFTSTQRGS